MIPKLNQTILLLLFACGIVGCDKAVNEREEAIAAIEKTWGHFEDNGQKLDGSGSMITDAGMEHLKGLNQL